MTPVAELEAAYFQARRDPAFLETLADLLRNYVGRETPLFEARRLTQSARRRAHLPQARGSRAHRRAQDQQRARPGAAREADGQAARHRGNRRRAARRRDRHRLRAARAVVRRLHGRGRHAAAVAQRLPDGAARRDRAPRGRRQPDAQGRHQRSDARLGRDRRRQLLPPGIRARPASVPADGPRVPVGHRARGEAADAPNRSAACRTRSSPASAAAATPWASSTRSSTTPMSA